MAEIPIKKQRKSLTENNENQTPDEKLYQEFLHGLRVSDRDAEAELQDSPLPGTSGLNSNGANRQSIQPSGIFVDIISSKKAFVRWNFGIELPSSATFCLQVIDMDICMSEENNDRQTFEVESIKLAESSYIVKTIPGHRYSLSVGIAISNNVCDSMVKLFRARFSKDELQKLMNAAKRLNEELSDELWYIEDKTTPFTYIHRAQLLSRWEALKEHSPNYIKQKIQNKMGHPGCAIIHELKLQGSWFCTKTFKGGRITKSPYGNRLLEIDAATFFLKKHPNLRLYFCDFYCINGPHYVSIVVCEAGSSEERVCQDAQMIHLPIEKNDFMTIKKVENGYECMYASALYINLFITMQMPWKFEELKEVGIAENFRDSDKSYSHNSSCKFCNFDENGNIRGLD